VSALRQAGAALGALAAVPVGLALLALRPRWRVGLRERLGRPPHAPGGVVWVHGASVGEVGAALSLVDRLAEGGHAVCVSSMTTTGREVVLERRPDVPAFLAPLDHPWCVDAALDRVRPQVLVLVEAELWPAWIAAASRRGVPVVVVSGRVSDRAARRYARLSRLVAPTLRRLAAVGARSARDAERFVALGVPEARVHVTGNLKLEPDAQPAALAPELRRAIEGVPLLVAGSTHAPEEEVALAALEAATESGLELALVLAPRRLERADEVEALVRGAGRVLHRRTRLAAQPLAPGEVLLLDTLGELPALWPHARLAFVGGTLAPRGGHNVLEPALSGLPVLFGPHTGSAPEAAELLLGCGAGWRVRDAWELAAAVVELLRDPDAARARGEAGRKTLDAHRGAAERSAALVESALRVQGGRPEGRPPRSEAKPSGGGPLQGGKASVVPR
jgi:3-deoxy-D-manno-octulosonic-acid transferase